MAIQTRLGQHGIGVRPYAGFIAKTAAPDSGPHPFEDGTRLGQMAIGTRPYAGFVAKAETEISLGAIAVKKVRRRRPRLHLDDYEKYLESLTPDAPPLTMGTLLRRVRSQPASTAIITLEPSWTAVHITNLDDAIAQASRPVPIMPRMPWDETDDEETLIRFLTSIS